MCLFFDNIHANSSINGRVEIESTCDSLHENVIVERSDVAERNNIFEGNLTPFLIVDLVNDDVSVSNGFANAFNNSIDEKIDK